MQRSDNNGRARATVNARHRYITAATSMRPKDSGQLDQLVAKRRSIKRGDALFRAGDRFKCWYSVISAALKSTVTSLDGQTGHRVLCRRRFRWVGWHTYRPPLVQHDCVGRQRSSRPALHCNFRVQRVAPALHMNLQKAMSREIVRDHQMMLLLGSMRAEERLATFLLNLAQRLRAVSAPMVNLPFK